MSSETCICCEATRNRGYLAGLRQCTDCGHVWADATISDDELQKLYGERYFRGDEYADYAREAPALAKNFRRRVRTLVRRHPAGGFLWEIGAAYGYFLKVAGDHFTVAGCDVSDFAAAYARSQLGLDVQTGDYLAVSPPRTCDVICLWDTIEHMRSPQLCLEKARTELGSGGTLAVSTGDIGAAFARWRGAKWRLIHPPTHLHYFTRASLTRLLARLGFDAIQTSYEPFCRSADAAAYRLLGQRRGAWGKAIYGGLRNAGLLRFTFSINTRDIMTVYARKG